MAEDKLNWLRSNEHESAVITYGTFGTADYDEPRQEWNFMRNANASFTEEYGADNIDCDPRFRLRLFNGSVTLAQPFFTRTTECMGTRSWFKKAYLGFAATSPGIQQVTDDDSRHDKAALTGQSVALGCAAFLDSGSTDSSSSKTPLASYIAGLGRDELRLVCAGRKDFVFDSLQGRTVSVQMPSFVQGLSTSWISSEPIQQVIFSLRSSTQHRGSFLAIRQISKTEILEPLLQRDAICSQSADSSSLNLDKVLSLDISVTGNERHCDIAFDPSDRRQFAIIDTLGNWSIWRIHGRKTYTARTLRQARLRCSGKIFSWESSKRPRNVGLYFDGWHRILWTSSDRQSYDQILVCNRQSAKVFNMSGDAVCSIDVRLDTRKANSYILDVCFGPFPHLFFILTTSRLLLFDSAAKSWKRTKTQTRWALVCSWRHFYNPTDWSLKMALVKRNEEFLICLYTSFSTSLRIFPSHLYSGKNGVSITSSTPYSIHLPMGDLTSPISYINLATVQVGNLRSIPDHIPYMLQIMVHLKDLSLVLINAEWMRSSQIQVGDSERSRDLHLPPNRNLQTRSERYVDRFEDEYDLTGFVTFDAASDRGHMNHSGLQTEGHLVDHVVRNRIRINLNVVSADVRPTLLPKSSEVFPHVKRFLERLRWVVERSTALTSTCKLSSTADLVAERWEVEDIESDSATFQQAIVDIGRDFGGTVQLMSYNQFEHLSELYEKLFNRYVQNLSSGVGDRTRVQRERSVRRIVLDLQLASHILRPLPTLSKPRPSQAARESELQVMNDPMFEGYSHNTQVAPPRMSASQPLVSARNETNPSSRTQPLSVSVISPLPEVLNRLATYTTVSNPPSEEQIANELISEHISALLSHLPFDTNVHPNDHDWRSTDSAPASAQPHRGVERERNIGQLTDAVDVASSRRQQTLPIRASVFSPEHLRGINTTQIDQTAIMSDQGPFQTEKSVYTQPALEGMTLTQPEKGLFGSRSAPSGQGQARKKRRRAGF